MKSKLFFTAVLFSFLFLPIASSHQTTYLALNPDETFCKYIEFGGFGRGEYTLTVIDPGYPNRPWVDNHRTSYTSSIYNPVSVPICFNTRGRRIGDEALLEFTLDAPDTTLEFNYGICVSRHEDVDVIESLSNPCDTTIEHTDLFSMDFVDSDIYTQPGQDATTTLLVYSEFDSVISLDKESGPSMNISRTSVQTPGEESVVITINAPTELGDYPFSITGSMQGCDLPSCTKTASGTLHISNEALEGFTISLTPGERNTQGIQYVTYFLVINNHENDQNFSVNLDIEDELTTTFRPQEMQLIRGARKQATFLVTPQTDEHNVYIIRVAVEGDIDGIKYAEALLTVDEPPSDANRAAEENPQLGNDADVLEDLYDDGPDLRDVNDFNDRRNALSPNNGDPAPDSFPWGIVMIIPIAVAIIIIVYFIFKRTRVTKDIETSYYE